MQAIEANHRRGRADRVSTRDGDGEVVVDVADNGCGIPDDVLPHIFDPFFTTKGVGDGTGLGLSITHGMVSTTAAGWRSRAPRRGTRFRVILATAGK